MEALWISCPRARRVSAREKEIMLLFSMRADLS